MIFVWDIFQVRTLHATNLYTFCNYPFPKIKVILSFISHYYFFNLNVYVHLKGFPKVWIAIQQNFKSYCRFYIRVMSYGWRILDSLGRKWRVGGALEHVCTVLITFSTCTFPWETCWQTYLCHHVLIHNKLVMGWDSRSNVLEVAFECNELIEGFLIVV